MRTPDTLVSLVDHGIIEEVVRPLMSGKEAHIYLVIAGGEYRVAKIYKEAQNRTFQHRSEYTEGRKVRNSRDQRAMTRRSGYGRAQSEAAWRTAEVDMIYRLRTAGVRVPEPYHFIDGVLIMELITDAEGFPAPRLGDLTLTPEEANGLFEGLMREVVRMLCAGVVHGDLSDFNVLLGAEGPVVIDFPQAVDASGNQNARKLLIRDVDNLFRFRARFPDAPAALPYAQEMWELYQRNALTPDTRLTGRFRGAQRPADTSAVLGLISDAARDERRRREARGLDLRGTEPTEALPVAGQRDLSVPRREAPQERGGSSARRAPHDRASNGAPRGPSGDRASTFASRDAHADRASNGAPRGPSGDRASTFARPDQRPAEHGRDGVPRHDAEERARSGQAFRWKGPSDRGGQAAPSLRGAAGAATTPAGNRMVRHEGATHPSAPGPERAMQRPPPSTSVGRAAPSVESGTASGDPGVAPASAAKRRRRRKRRPAATKTPSG